MKSLFIDNFNAFTYNLAEEFERRGIEVLVYRNDIDSKIIDETIKKFKPNLIVVLGIGALKDAGNSIEIIRNYYEKIPILGVNLGHQCIIKAFEGSIGKAPEATNWNSLKISHDDKTIFKKIQNPFRAGRYNALAAVEVPYSLEVSARSDNDIVMGVRHKEHFVEGLQFEPASILTPAGSRIIDNLIKEIKK